MQEKDKILFALNDYKYNLPENRIAQKPLAQRDCSKLLMLDRKTGAVSHRFFSDFSDYLLSSDVLVLNNTKVIPGRLTGKKQTGGKVEILILNYEVNKDSENISCECMVKASKRPNPGTWLFFKGGLKAEVLSSKDAVHKLKFTCSGDFEKILNQVGQMPLPPYILKNRKDKTEYDDKNTYQTVYASQKGAVAAPTAGLHFTHELLEKIKAKGVQVVYITLHVGYGTFVPVRVSDIRKHKMHSEWFSIPGQTADVVNNAKKNKARVIGVGTTSVRTLEYALNENGNLESGTGNCDLFIYPGYKFKIINAMITNFHLPESTLLMLVSAFAGRKNILNAYNEAVKADYRFYSYGDAMFIS